MPVRSMTGYRSLSQVTEQPGLRSIQASKVTRPRGSSTGPRGGAGPARRGRRRSRSAGTSQPPPGPPGAGPEQGRVDRERFEVEVELGPSASGPGSLTVPFTRKGRLPTRVWTSSVIEFAFAWMCPLRGQPGRRSACTPSRRRGTRRQPRRRPRPRPGPGHRRLDVDPPGAGGGGPGHLREVGVPEVVGRGRYPLPEPGIELQVGRLGVDLERRAGRVVGVDRRLPPEREPGRAVNAVGPDDLDPAVLGLDVDRDVVDRERELVAPPDPPPEPGRCLVMEPRGRPGVETQARQGGVNLAAGQAGGQAVADRRREAVAERLREVEPDQLPRLQRDPAGRRVNRPFEADPVEQLPLGRQLERRPASRRRSTPGS